MQIKKSSKYRFRPSKSTEKTFSVDLKSTMNLHQPPETRYRLTSLLKNAKKINIDQLQIWNKEKQKCIKTPDQQIKEDEFRIAPFNIVKNGELYSPQSANKLIIKLANQHCAFK